MQTCGAAASNCLSLGPHASRSSAAWLETWLAWQPSYAAGGEGFGKKPALPASS